MALALKQERPDLQLVGVDVSSGALSVARMNSQRLGLQVEWVQGDLLDGVKCDAVLANLPYIADDELLPPEVARYEPRGALLGGNDGLDLVRRLIEQAGDRPEVALIALEIGRHAQGAATQPRCSRRPDSARSSSYETWLGTSGLWWDGGDRVRAPDRGRWGGALPLRHRLWTCLRSRQRSSDRAALRTQGPAGGQGRRAGG